MIVVASLDTIDVGTGTKSSQNVLDFDMENLVTTLTKSHGKPCLLHDGSLLFAEVTACADLENFLTENHVEATVTIHILRHV